MRKALFILADLEDRDLIWLLQNGDIVTVAAGETLISAGQPVRHLYFVIEGKLAVLLPDGARDRLAPADVVGEMSFVENRLPSATVVADADSTLLAVPREAVLLRLEEDLGFAARFYRALAVFLSDRLRTARGGADSDELDERFLERLHVAGDRFIRLLAMAKGRTV